MKSNTFGVHFIVRSNRKDKQDCVPIYAKVFLNGQILMISTNHKIKPSEWHTIITKLLIKLPLTRGDTVA